MINNGFQIEESFRGFQTPEEPVEPVSRFLLRLKNYFNSMCYNYKTKRMSLSLFSGSELETIRFKKRNDRSPFQKFKNCKMVLTKRIGQY